MKSMILEVCIESAESAINAELGGANRVELCDNLMEGGTTPSSGMVAVTLERVQIPVMMMIRPRGGDFLYTDLEYEIMLRDIEEAKRLVVHGVVFGILTPDGRVDKMRTKQLIEAARPLSVSFHRAFDMTVDPLQALEDLIDLGVDRILTSGQEPSVSEGTALIAELVRRAESGSSSYRAVASTKTTSLSLFPERESTNAMSRVNTRSPAT